MKANAAAAIAAQRPALALRSADFIEKSSTPAIQPACLPCSSPGSSPGRQTGEICSWLDRNQDLADASAARIDTQVRTNRSHEAIVVATETRVMMQEGKRAIQQLWAYLTDA